MPNADTAQVDFTAENGGSTTFGYTTNSSTQARSAGTIYLQQTRPPAAARSAPSDVELSSGFTGNMNVAIYDSDGNGGSTPTSGALAGTLLGHCTAVNNPATGVNTFTLTSPLNLLNGHTYFIAIWTDTAFTEKADTVTVNTSSVALDLYWRILLRPLLAGEADQQIRRQRPPAPMPPSRRQTQVR